MSDALDLSRLPTFSAFARECDDFAASHRMNQISLGAGLDPISAESHGKRAERYETAARHARLLERIEQFCAQRSQDRQIRAGSAGYPLALEEVLRLLREEVVKP